MSKRSNINENDSLEGDDVELNPSAKRQKPSDDQTEKNYALTPVSSNALTTTVNARNTSLILRKDPNARTSSLPAPEVYLSGHDGAIYSIDFDPSGDNFCSGSMDRQIFLWKTFEDCKNYNVLSGHKNAVLQVKWQTEGSIISCSADKTVALWDANRGERTRKFSEHTAIVNSCAVALENPNLFVSGSDDCTAIIWDNRSKYSSNTIYHDYQVCSVALSKDGNSLYTAGVDNIIRRYDTRMSEFDTPEFTLEGHLDTVTGLSLSPDGQYLLSNSMDSTLRVWDIRSFASNQNQRCVNILNGVHHGAEKLLLKCAWSADQEYITSGSADRIVHLWESTNYKEVCGWPGHKASINEVIFHPKEPIIMSCSSDKHIILGEFTP